MFAFCSSTLKIVEENRKLQNEKLVKKKKTFGINCFKTKANNYSFARFLHFDYNSVSTAWNCLKQLAFLMISSENDQNFSWLNLKDDKKT